MPSDEVRGPADETADGDAGTMPDAESQPVTVAAGYAGRARRRKIALLAVLLVLIALLTYTVFYFEANRRLPVPRVVPAVKGIEPPQYLYSITGEGRDALTRPIGVAVGRNGRVYVVDFGTRVVKAFTTSGTYLFSFNVIKDGSNTKLRNPIHLAVDGQDNVWVTDRRLQSVYVFDEDGKYLRKFLPANGLDAEWLPFGVFIAADGGVFLTDIPGVTLHRVLVFDKGGNLKTMFGRGGLVLDAKSSPGTFSFPNGIVVSPGSGASREMFVADSNNRRLQVYSVAGSYRRTVRTEGNPRGIAMDAKKRLYVVDVLSHKVDIFSTAGEHLASFGENGYAPGQFQYPEDVALDRRGRIYVSDRENHQVQVWGYPTLDVAGITKIAPNRWPWCLAPLPLLLLPLLFRKRRFHVTEDFVEGMVTADMVREMVRPRWRWIVTEQMHPAYVGRVVDGVDLGQLLEPEPYSHSDASALQERLGIPFDRAVILAMAKRARVLCTEDGELARLAVLLGIDVYDRQAFLERFARKGKA